MIENETKEQEVKYARLILRAGTWVSLMDESGGNRSRQLEINTIHKTLLRFRVEKDYKSLQPVFEVALASYRAWDKWSEDLAEFPNEIRNEMPKLALEMRQCLYDMAYSVAIRYRERNFLSVFLIGLKVSLKNFFRLGGNHDMELSHYLNISAPEKSALNELAEILDMPQRVIV